MRPELFVFQTMTPSFCLSFGVVVVAGFYLLFDFLEFVLHLNVELGIAIASSTGSEASSFHRPFFAFHLWRLRTACAIHTYIPMYAKQSGS